MSAKPHGYSCTFSSADHTDIASERYWSPSTSTSNGSIIVIDAGSSGSRVHVYRLQCSGPDELLRIDEAVESLKIEPGISSFVNTPEKAAHSLRPLIRYVENVIPAREHSSTDLVLLATAGLRALPIHDAETILKATRALIRAESPFRVKRVDMISRKEEAVFAWTAVNYATNRIGHDGIRSTVGVLDMGGGSAQVVIQMPERIAGGREHAEISVEPPSKSWKADYMLHWNSEDYGANVARRRYAATLWAARKQDAIANIPDPCLPVGLIDEHFVGTGNYKACLDRISSMLATNPLPVGMKLPKWALSESYVGLSEYWYTTADVFFTGGRYNSFSFFSPR